MVDDFNESYDNLISRIEQDIIPLIVSINQNYELAKVNEESKEKLSNLKLKYDALNNFLTLNNENFLISSILYEMEDYDYKDLPSWLQLPRIHLDHFDKVIFDKLMDIYNNITNKYNNNIYALKIYYNKEYIDLHIELLRYLNINFVKNENYWYLSELSRSGCCHGSSYKLKGDIKNNIITCDDKTLSESETKLNKYYNLSDLNDYIQELVNKHH